MANVMTAAKKNVSTWKYCYYAASVWALWLIPWINRVTGETNLPPLQPLARLVINAVLINLVVSYFFLLKDPSVLKPPAAFWLLMFPALISLCAVFPVFSGDLMEYLIRGRILAVYHLNPAMHTPVEFPNDVLYSHSIWRTTPHTYGPLFILFQTLPALVFGRSIVGMIWLEKIIMLIFMGLAVFYFARIVREFIVSGRERLLGLFAFSPLLIVHTVVNGHNDVIMVSLTVVSVYYLLKKRYTRSFLFWTLAFLVKYTVIVTLPILVMHALAEKNGEKKSFPWAFAGRQLLINASLIVIAFFPVWRGLETFRILVEVSGWFYNNTIPYLVYQTLTLLRLPIGPRVVRGLFLIASVFFNLCALWFVWKDGGKTPKKLFRWMGLINLFFCATLTSPLQGHYLLWAFPWLILSEWPLSTLLVILYSLTGLLAYWKRINYLMAISAIIYLAAVCLVEKRRKKNPIRAIS